MKRLLVIVGGLVLAGVVTCGGGLAYFAYSSAELDRDGRAYVDAALPAIVQRFSVDELEARATPELLASTPREQRARRFGELSRALGELRENEGVSGQLRLSHADGVTKKGGDFVAKVRFEQGRALVNLRLLRVGEEWQIDSFDVDVIAGPVTSTGVAVEEKPAAEPVGAVQGVPLRVGDRRPRAQADSAPLARPACRSAKKKIVFDSLSIGPTVIVGSPAMWPYEIELGVERQRASLDRCATAPATGTASFVIGPNGAPNAVEVTSTSPGFPARCVTAAIEAWRFTRPVAGGEVRARGYVLVAGGSGPVAPLTYAAVKSAFESQREALLACKGWTRARVKLEVAPGGETAAADVSDASPGDVAGCLGEAAGRLRFPPLECGDRLEVEARLTN